jgi:putative membrane protein
MSPATELSLDRTVLAHERTLMAWIRTSTSLISFGFSIYKFFQYLVETSNTRRPYKLFGPREYAITMIGVGITALAIAMLNHRRELKILEQTYGKSYRSTGTKLALVIFLTGLAFLLLVLLRE